MSNIVIVGNLVDTPTLNQVAGGVAVANFAVAERPRKYNRDSREWEDGAPIFWKVAAWRELAEHVAASLTKGNRVIVIGQPRNADWERDGQQVKDIEVVADHVGAELRFANVTVEGGAQRSTPPARRPASNGWQPVSDPPF